MLALCILSGFTPVMSVNVIAETSGICGENLTWSIDSGILTINGTGEMYDLYTPLDGMWVDKNIHWPNGVQSIIISEGVTSIGKEAFSRILGLENVSISNTVTTIKDNAFLGCSELRSIVIPSSVEIIGAGVFAGCKNLTRIIIDEGNPTYTADKYALYTKD